jgi:dihydroorotase
MSYLGIAGLNYDEYCNPQACDVAVLERTVRSYPDLVRGIKVRMGTEGVCGGRMEPLMRALQAGEDLGLPVMMHLSDAPPQTDDLLPLLRRGDIVTHAFTGLSERIVDERGRLRDTTRAARERGVLFDIGHGSGSFSFETAEALAAQQFWPDTISTDLHQVSLPGPNLLEPLAQEFVARVKGDGSPQFTLLTAMSKFLHLGMELSEVVRATTARPAEVLRLGGQIGTLRPGALADVAILRLEEGRYLLHDIHGNERLANRLLRHVDTFVAGRRLLAKELPPAPPWIRLVDREPEGT